jgi:hypothetical protein
MGSIYLTAICIKTKNKISLINILEMHEYDLTIRVFNSLTLDSHQK